MAGDVSGRVAWGWLGVILAAQVALGLWGIDDVWAKGHNGWNGAAYHMAARNTLRFGTLFPAQYYAGTTPPPAKRLYTHAPLALHLHTTAAVAVLGDRPSSVRAVAVFHGVASVAALFWLVATWWSRRHAILTAALYVATPLNAIYLNMTNHPSGYIAWGALCFGCFFTMLDRLRAPPEPTQRSGILRAYAAMLGTYFMSAQWDWASNYLALAIALTWAVVGVGRLLRGASPHLSRKLEVALLLGFSAFVLWTLWLFFRTVEWGTGSTADLLRVYGVRQIAAGDFAKHLEVVPPAVFSVPLLAAGALWLLVTLGRLFAGRLTPRDAMPLAFALGGALHYWFFKRSAMVHSYWGWYLMPFFAFAGADLLVLARALLARLWPEGASLTPAARWGRQVALATPLAFYAPVLLHDARVVPPARDYLGAIEYFVPRQRSTYRSLRREMAFAEFVRERTDRDTVVLLHSRLVGGRILPQWRTTLDRATHLAKRMPKVRRGRSRSSVFLAHLRSIPERRLAAIAAQHAVHVVGHYVMVDFRAGPPSLTVWKLGKGTLTPGHAFWQTRYEPPPFILPDPARAEAMRARFAAMATPAAATEPPEALPPPAALPRPPRPLLR